MLQSFVLLILALAVTVSVLSLILVGYKPDIAFLLALFSIPLWVYTAYGSNMIEVVDLATNQTMVYYDIGAQMISVGGLMFSALVLYLASTAYGGENR